MSITRDDGSFDFDRGERQDNSGSGDFKFVLTEPNEYPPVFLKSVIEVVVMHLEDHDSTATFIADDDSFERCTWSNAMEFGYRQRKEFGGYAEVTLHQTEQLKKEMLDLLTCERFENSVLALNVSASVR